MWCAQKPKPAGINKKGTDATFNDVYDQTYVNISNSVLGTNIQSQKGERTDFDIVFMTLMQIIFSGEVTWKKESNKPYIWSEKSGSSTFTEE